MDFLKRVLGTIKPADIIEKELAQSRLQLLTAESDREHTDALVALLTKRIMRLEAHKAPIEVNTSLLVWSKRGAS